MASTYSPRNTGGEALEAFVQLAEGVHEADVIEVLAVGFADDLAFELVALEAIFHKLVPESGTCRRSQRERTTDPGAC